MKINFVYHTLQQLGSGWMGSEGLRNALEKNRYLDYTFNQMGKEPCDVDRLRANPIFYVRGFLDGRMPFVARGGNQFKATWNSESWYTRHGHEDTSTYYVKKNQEHFNMMFTCSESDIGLYSIPTYFLPSWGDTTVLENVKEPEIFDRLGFIGGTKGREDFLNKDSKGIIDHQQTKYFPGDHMTQTKKYTELINCYQSLVSPPGRCFTGMCGRAFEIMACKRTAFVYLNEDTMFEHMKYFRDGVDLVYFKDMDELYAKWDVYKDQPNILKQIAENGYNKVQRFHNQDMRADYIVSCMEKEHKVWLEDQAKISDEVMAL